VNDDASLIAAARSGQPAAFGQLVSRYQNRLFTTLVAVAGSMEDAREIAQDTFVQAFIKLETFRHDSAFYTWLYRIAMNLAASRRRRHRPSQSVERLREASGREPIDPTPGPSAALERQERAAQVRAALASLDPEHRTILVLREMDELSYEAIAELLEIPPGTVRSRLHRARMQLRERLKHMLHAEVT